MMKRREFITLLGGTAVAWPLAARAQRPAMPVIGLLHSGTPESQANNIAIFRKSLNEIGLSRAATLSSSIAGRTIKRIGCRSWRRSLCACG
jgi:putative ABC transport system substrate-binding protein